jgi:hypothetical protein
MSRPLGCLLWLVLLVVVLVVLSVLFGGFRLGTRAEGPDRRPPMMSAATAVQRQAARPTAILTSYRLPRFAQLYRADPRPSIRSTAALTEPSSAIIRRIT